MSEQHDLVIVGAGPAGLSAAVQGRALGLDVVVLDEQPAPGGQVWRALEARSGRPGGGHAGENAGANLIRAFRASGAAYRPGMQVWQIEPGFEVYASRAGATERIRAKAVLLATGAQERPVPFPGWTLPGVMTVGAAQILLKTAGQIPAEPVVIAGTGPLVLLYACQLLEAGGRIASILDTAPRSNRMAALPRLAGSLSHPGDLVKGLRWLWRLKRAGIPMTRGVTGLRALGKDAVEAVSYQVEGRETTAPARLVLVHEGVVPSIHMTLSLGCKHRWREDQMCFVPQVDAWGESSVPHLFMAGDGTGIGGAASACHAGELAAIGAAARLGLIGSEAADARAARIRASLAKSLAIRPMLDALYRPRPEVLAPEDDTIVCRCEEVTAGQVRAAAGVGIAGPNQVKSFTRCGMGPCQGRQCGYTVSALIAEATGASMDDVGFFRIRPPLKPVTLGELASIDSAEVAVMP
jgi:NADPH-dependent 2,4-dienoyl-CoA reductase/sulfur reductase-like enzyme